MSLDFLHFGAQLETHLKAMLLYFRTPTLYFRLTLKFEFISTDYVCQCIKFPTPTPYYIQH